MEPVDPFEEDVSGTTFRDLIMLTLLGFIAMVIMLLPHIKKSQETAEDYRPPGNVIVEIHWPDDMPYDVDLWVKAPGSPPVGFWNQGSEMLNLLRDDLGGEGDATDRNYEMIYSRGIPPGRYIVNVHMYGQKPAGVVVPVKVIVAVRGRYGTTQQILQSEVRLAYHNQEETAFAFRLTGDGELVDGSVSTLRQSLIRGIQGN